jgi:mRNA interferase MazF
MMNSATVAAWVDGYIQAWNSNDAMDIGRLFTVDAAYYTGPFDPPWRGREAIVQNWLDRQDASGDTAFRYEILASTAETGIIRGWTQYHQPPREYSNIWLIRFDPHGQCREFTEWWLERPISEVRDSNIETKTATPPGGGRRVINQGDIYWVPLTEQNYTHPHVVIQDNVFNHSRISTLVVCALTTNLRRAKDPGNVLLEAGEANLPKQSVVVVSQVSTVDKTQLGEYIGTLSEQRLNQILAGMRFLQVFIERR